MDYGHSSEIAVDDPRQERWAKERAERGFDSTELWSLDASLAMHIAPRLRCFMEAGHSTPFGVDKSEWQQILGKMVRSFEWAASEERWKDVVVSDEIQEGFELFGKNYLHLWN